MAHEKFIVEVLTPEGEVFNDEVEQVSTRTGVGSLGILARHQPLLGLLEPTELRLYRSDVRRRAVRPGRGLRAGLGPSGSCSSSRRPRRRTSSTRASWRRRSATPRRRCSPPTTTPRPSAAPPATRSAGRRSCGSRRWRTGQRRSPLRPAVRPGTMLRAWMSGSCEAAPVGLGVHRSRRALAPGQPGARRAQRLRRRGARRPAPVRGPRPLGDAVEDAIRRVLETGQAESGDAERRAGLRARGRRQFDVDLVPGPSGVGRRRRRHHRARGGSRPSWPRRTAATR